MAAPRARRTKALVLSKTKLKETDLIVRLLAEDGALVDAVAKGARKPGSRMAARTQLFSLVDVLLARGRSLEILAEAELVTTHTELAANYDATIAASAVADVARLATRDAPADSFSFAITARAFEVLQEAAAANKSQDQLALVVAAYTFKLLSRQGWRPETQACVACGDTQPTWFAASAGGALCDQCVRDVFGAEPAAQGELAWVGALLALTLDQLASTKVPPELSHWLLFQAATWAETHLETRVRALEFALGTWYGQADFNGPNWQ